MSPATIRVVSDAPGVEILTPVNDPATLAEIDRVRASGILGRHGRQRNLFDFLVERSLDIRPPKEMEIGRAVFWKRPEDEQQNDSVARVYVHRLRRRLEEYYLRQGADCAIQLVIPKGEYRIVGLCRQPAETPADAALAPLTSTAIAPAQQPRAGRRIWLALIGAAVVALVCVNVVALTLMGAKQKDPDSTLRASVLWSDLVKSNRPLMVVIGDYYMFGEYENRTSLKRLIHEPEIDSKADLVARYMGNPATADRYADLALQYLPTSTASVLSDLAPILGHGKQVQIVLASELTPDKLKNDDIIYVGLLGNMAGLRDRVFSHSRFAIGDSFDQIVDRVADKTYTSEALLAAPGDTMYRDYGFVSAFEGPSGNRVIIMSGTRDTGLLGVSESLTTEASLGALNRMAKGGKDFEALFEVKGQKHVNLRSQPVALQGVDSRAVWTPGGN